MTLHVRQSLVSGELAQKYSRFNSVFYSNLSEFSFYFFFFFLLNALAYKIKKKSEFWLTVSYVDPESDGLSASSSLLKNWAAVDLFKFILDDGPGNGEDDLSVSLPRRRSRSSIDLSPPSRLCDILGRDVVFN